MAGPRVKDSQWIRQAFLVHKADLDKNVQVARTFSTASLKFTDTTPGGNLAINPPPQFTRNADLKVKGRYVASEGQGRYYSEAIDDHAQIIYMRMGLPAFNSLTTFFTGFYNTGAGHLARTGRAPSAFYYLGRAVGFVVSVMSWKVLAVHALGSGLRFLANKPSSKFYYLKPAMPQYWSAVTTIVNQIAVNRGIVPRAFGPDQQPLSDGYEFDAAALAKLHDLLPDVFKEKGGIDVFAMANRAQRLQRKSMKLQQQLSDQSTSTDVIAAFNQLWNTKLTDEKPDFHAYMDRWFGTAVSQVTGDDGKKITTEEFKPQDQSWASRFGEFLQAELDDGAAFASFRVNYTGPMSESFSNSVGESELSSKINGMSSQARSTSFSFANGNLIGGALGAAIGGVTNAVKDLATGVMDQFEVNGLLALGGAAFVDIPKHWQSSSAQLTRMSYTINLVSPYGNPISQLINLYVPLAMLLAAALPISTGKQSYTSPFLVELYDPGRCQTRLGMIESIQVTRGVGNLGYNRDGHAMGIDVTFSVVDMSSVLHMPINQYRTGNLLESAAQLALAAPAAIGGGAIGGAVGGALGGVVAGPVGGAVGTAGGAVTGAALAGGAAVANAIGAFDEDTIFTDYMAVLAGMGLSDQIYPFRKMKLNITRRMENYSQWTSPAKWAGMVGDIWPARMWSSIYTGITR